MHHSVSIIIPNYNHAQFLEQRIESVLCQTFQDFEIIILDDLSTDKSKTVIEKYRDHNKVHKIIYNNKNSGSTFRQWKIGLEIANYDFVWIAESDDFADKDFLAIAMQKLKENKDSVLFFSNSRVVDENNSLLENNTIIFGEELDENLFSKDFTLSGNVFVEKILFYKNLIQNASAVVFKKDVALKNIQQIIDFKMCGDWLFWILLLKNNMISYSALELNFFRTSSNTTRNHNTYTKKRLRIYEEVKVLDKLIHFFSVDKSLIQQKKESILNGWIKLFNRREIFTKEFLSITRYHFLNISPLKLIIFTLNKKQ